MNSLFNEILAAKELKWSVFFNRKKPIHKCTHSHCYAAIPSLILPKYISSGTSAWDFMYICGFIIIVGLLLFIPIGKLVSIFVPSLFKYVQNMGTSTMLVEYWCTGARVIMILVGLFFVIAILSVIIISVARLSRDNWKKAGEILAEKEFKNEASSK